MMMAETLADYVNVTAKRCIQLLDEKEEVRGRRRGFSSVFDSSLSRVVIRRNGIKSTPSWLSCLQVRVQCIDPQITLLIFRTMAIQACTPERRQHVSFILLQSRLRCLTSQAFDLTRNISRLFRACSLEFLVRELPIIASCWASDTCWLIFSGLNLAK